MTKEIALSLSQIYYLPFPDDIYGMVHPRRDGGYTIAINSNLPPEEQERALEHELAHIRLDHFNSDKSIRTIEAEADKLAGGAYNA